ncbi:flavin reductase [Roseovarius aestuarii]|nr:flavin reductase [Roseovarius aestuarii]
MAEDSAENHDAPRRLRQAFGSFATGVTVVTAHDADGAPIGFTANSFTSVSLDPPLLLVCLAKSSGNLTSFSQAQRFAVNILKDTQRDVSARFASRVEDRFSNTDWHSGPEGTPVLDGTVAWFECVTDNLVDAGDHVILIGRITNFDHSDARPLAYLRGHYLDLGIAETAAEQVSHHGGVRVGCVLDCLGKVLLQRTTEGWTLPFGKTCAGFREARAELEKTLAAQNVNAEIGALYSVFEAPNGNATWMIFQGDLHSFSQGEELQLFDPDALPLAEIDARQLRAALRRYASEARQSRFGLYVDDAHSSGNVTQVEARPTPWTRFITGQEGQQ